MNRVIGEIRLPSNYSKPLEKIPSPKAAKSLNPGSNEIIVANNPGLKMS
jgi:hypothetical protein